MKKLLVVGIIALFVGASIIPSTLGTTEQKIVNSGSTSRGYIQGLINNASAGDTIYIPSGIYYENIIINKSISLFGEDKNTTIIDGSNIGAVIYVSADWVNISGFTIRKSSYPYAGIYIISNYTTIFDNKISNNNHGIYLRDSSGNTITGNNITDNNDDGISLSDSNGNNITSNTISKNWNGIYLGVSNDNTITGNTITNNNCNGIVLGGSNDNTITGNSITDNKNGIHPYSSILNFILKNNFIDNERDALFEYEIPLSVYKNIWKQNYWNESRILPKLILGWLFYYSNPRNYFPIIIPWFNIDWLPAQEPYDIGG